MKPIFSHILLIISLLFAIGCAPTYYRPTLMNAPNFQKKGQTYFAAHLGGYGGDVQAAYAFAEHFAVQGNFGTADYEETTNATPPPGSGTTAQTRSTKGSLAEVAVGYFRPLDDVINLGIYGGYGWGGVKNDWDIEGASSAKLRKYFLQGTVGVNGKRVECIGSLKLAGLDYHDLSQTYTNQTYIEEFDVLRNTLMVAEYGVAVRVGFKNVKFQLQGNAMRQLTATKALFRREGSSIGVGVCFLFDTQKDKK